MGGCEFSSGCLWKLSVGLVPSVVLHSNTHRTQACLLSKPVIKNSSRKIREPPRALLGSTRTLHGVRQNARALAEGGRASG